MFHTPVARTCSCLLGCADRLAEAPDEFSVNLVSRLLDTDAVEIGAILRDIQASGAVNCRGGRVVVVDRPRLLAGACACYGLERRELERLLRVPRDSAEPAVGASDAPLETWGAAN